MTDFVEMARRFHRQAALKVKDFSGAEKKQASEKLKEATSKGESLSQWFEKKKSGKDTKTDLEREREGMTPKQLAAARKGDREKQGAAWNKEHERVMGSEAHGQRGRDYDPKQRTPEEEQKLEAQRKSEKKFTMGGRGTGRPEKSYPDKSEDCGDPDLIPVSDEWSPEAREKAAEARKKGESHPSQIENQPATTSSQRKLKVKQFNMRACQN